MPRARFERIESLTVAMALAPGVYARNRMFEFFKKAGVAQARSRASMLAGIVKQLCESEGVTTVSVEPDDVPSGAARPRYVLRYRIPELSLSRVATLSRLELATLRVLMERAELRCLAADDEDQALVHAALADLLAPRDDDARETSTVMSAHGEASVRAFSDRPPRTPTE